MFQIDRYQTVSPGLTRAKTLIFLDLYTSPERRVLLLSVFKYTGRENAFRRINHQESVAQKDVVFPAPHTRGWRDPAPDRATGRRPHEPCQLPGLRAQRPTRPPGARGLRSPREALPPGLSPPRQRRGDPCPLDRSHEATSTRLRTPPPRPGRPRTPRICLPGSQLLTILFWSVTNSSMFSRYSCSAMVVQLRALCSATAAAPAGGKRIRSLPGRGSSPTATRRRATAADEGQTTERQPGAEVEETGFRPEVKSASLVV